MIKASDKVRYAIKNMILKNDTDNQQMLWWMLWGMMTISERKDWRIISRYQDRYTRSKFEEYIMTMRLMEKYND
mgnify:CR=1 FL=1|jgi:hypothetical protein|tara:strand:+ start:519 stop:740 length:222 start_codon:yes stop_codon:yes gene_type:complete